jgi:hypothetical protein
MKLTLKHAVAAIILIIRVLLPKVPKRRERIIWYWDAVENQHVIFSRFDSSRMNWLGEILSSDGAPDGERT